MTRRFHLVDVFGDGPFTGNPLAVVDDSAELDTETMQAITRWLNLSETTFLLSPTQAGADYRVRIFTLERELGFAGHPTLGSCHAWLSAGGRPRHADRVVQECGIGLVTLRRDDQGLAFAAPPIIREGPIDEAKLDEIAELLRIARCDIVDAHWADNGPGWAAILLKSAEAVLAVDPLRANPRRVDIGLIGPYPPAARSPSNCAPSSAITTARSSRIRSPAASMHRRHNGCWQRAGQRHPILPRRGQASVAAANPGGSRRRRHDLDRRGYADAVFL